LIISHREKGRLSSPQDPSLLSREALFASGSLSPKQEVYPGVERGKRYTRVEQRKEVYPGCVLSRRYTQGVY